MDVVLVTRVPRLNSDFKLAKLNCYEFYPASNYKHKFSDDKFACVPSVGFEPTLDGF